MLSVRDDNMPDNEMVFERSKYLSIHYNFPVIIEKLAERNHFMSFNVSWNSDTELFVMEDLRSNGWTVVKIYGD